MKELLERIAVSKGWHFEYGRDDLLNLEVNVLNPDNFYLYVDATEEEVVFDEFSKVRYRTYNGRFMLLRHSEMDRVYDTQMGGVSAEGKYERYIKPCKEGVMCIADWFCSDYTIRRWVITEVINHYSNNFDGVIVSYSVVKE